MSIKYLIEGLFGAAAVLISFGGVIGKLSPTALLIMTFWEIIFYAINLYVCTMVLKAIDMGGSVVIHMFGAYYGLLVTWICSPADSKQHKEKSSRYTSDLFSMIGTVRFHYLFT